MRSVLLPMVPAPTVAVNLVCGQGWKPWLAAGGGRAGGPWSSRKSTEPYCVCLGFLGLAQALLLFWEPCPPLRGLEREEEIVSRGGVG